MPSKVAFNFARKKKRDHDAARAMAGHVSVISTKTEERASWKNNMEFMLTVIGAAVGLGNIWRFPYLAYKFGGGAFLVPYFSCMILGGIPMFFMELALGQMLNTGVIGVFQICPLLKGIAIATVIMCFWVNTYYIVIMAWAIFYFFASFNLDVPWRHCNKAWNSDACLSVDESKSLKCSDGVCLVRGKNITESDTRTSVEEYWENRCLHVSAGMDSMGTIRWDLALALLLAWVLCYFCIFKGVSWTGKVAYFTALAPYVCIITLLVRAATLPGAVDGVKMYLIPDWAKLQESTVWIAAVTQIFYSYGVGFGMMIALGSYNRFHHDIMRDAIIISFINSGTSLLSGFMVFSIVGYMAHIFNKPVDEVAASGPGLAFLAYPQAVQEIPGSPIWALLFFFTLITVGLDSQFCCVEGITTTILDQWPELRPWRKVFLAGLCSTKFFIGLVFVAEGGMYVFTLFDTYAASGFTLLIIIFFECITVSYFYGVNRFYEVIKEMIGYKPCWFWKFTWLFSTPAICLSVGLYNVIYPSALEYLDYKYPWWSYLFSGFLVLSSTMWIPIYALYIWFSTKGTRKEKVRLLIRIPYTVVQLREINIEEREALEKSLPPP